MELSNRLIVVSSNGGIVEFSNRQIVELWNGGLVELVELSTR